MAFYEILLSTNCMLTPNDSYEVFYMIENKWTEITFYVITKYVSYTYNAIFKYPLQSIKISPTIMEISNLDLDNYTG